MQSTPETCKVCGAALHEPYIRCNECIQDVVDLCLYCFARGSETQQHRNNHAYEIMRSDFSLLSSDWTAADELNLLDAVSHCGLGNWNDIGKRIRKSPTECQRHYLSTYVENKSGKFISLENHSGVNRSCPVVLRCTEVPPRPAEGSALQQELSGYSAARADFSIEYDNYAELDLGSLHFDGEETEIEMELKQAMLDIYRRVIKERYRRRKLLRDYGLIHLRRHLMHDKKYYSTLGGPVISTMRALCKQMAPREWDQLMEGLHYERQLKKQISQLFECRRQGITRLMSARIYDELNRTREQERCERNLLDNAIAALRKEQWLSKQVLLGNVNNGVPSTMPQLAKREVRPLDIKGLPNYDKLSDTEKEFCSLTRLVPIMFLEAKKVLTAENDKLGHLKLASARHLLKIDVNKTRKIFDFLADQGLITKERILKSESVT